MQFSRFWLDIYPAVRLFYQSIAEFLFQLKIEIFMNELNQKYFESFHQFSNDLGMTNSVSNHNLFSMFEWIRSP